MKLADIIPLIQLEPLVQIDDLDAEIKTVCGCDLMSDVLAFPRKRHCFSRDLLCSGSSHCGDDRYQVHHLCAQAPSSRNN